MRQVLKRLQVALPHKAGFNTSDNSYTNEEFFQICGDYAVPHDPMKYIGMKNFIGLTVRCKMARQLYRP